MYYATGFIEHTLNKRVSFHFLVVVMEFSFFLLLPFSAFPFSMRLFGFLMVTLWFFFILLLNEIQSIE